MVAMGLAVEPKPGIGAHGPLEGPSRAQQVLASKQHVVPGTMPKTSSKHHSSATPAAQLGRASTSCIHKPRNHNHADELGTGVIPCGVPSHLQAVRRASFHRLDADDGDSSSLP